MSDDIRSMLRKVDAELGSIDKRRATLLERKATLEAWLAEENPAQQELTMAGGANGSAPLTAFLRNVLADGKPRKLHDLIPLVSTKGLVRTNTSPGRAIHFALVGLLKSGELRRNGEGEWVAKKH